MDTNGNEDNLHPLESGGSICFFPLRSNVAYFDEPNGALSLIERIKQAALLYDTIVFEAGVYQSVVMAHGDWELWMPRDRMSDEDINSIVQHHRPVGGDSCFVFYPEAGTPFAWPGLSGPVDRRLLCEFHTVAHDLSAEVLPWVHFCSVELTDEGNGNLSLLTRQLLPELDQLIPHPNQRLRRKIVKNLSRDLIVSEDLEAVTLMNPIYGSYLNNRIKHSPAPNLIALEVTCPNLSVLPWEQILEIREMESMMEFRRKLGELESIAKASLHNSDAWDEAVYRSHIFRSFHDDVVRELRGRQPKKLEAIGGIVIDVVIGVAGGLIGGLPGFLAGPAMTGLQSYIQHEQGQRSWVAAFLRLQPDKEY